MPFIDRVDAGHRLACRLRHFRDDPVVVLGLPRGGVPVAYEVAADLGAPLDVILVRKLGVPFQPELAMGAIGEGGVRVLNEDVINAAAVTADEFAAVEDRERRELERRAARYRNGRVRTTMQGKTALVVDDGMATGSTAFAACQVARELGANRVVLAVPVAPATTVRIAEEVADEIVCLESPTPFFGVGLWYHDFSQVSDEEVVALLQRAASGPARPQLPRAFAIEDHAADCAVELDLGDALVLGDLVVPKNAVGVVVFAHGSGSSRHSARNRSVARVLNRAGIGTLLFDLLTSAEESDRANVFDIELLARRLSAAVAWLRQQPAAADLPVGLFGASTGAAAALWAAAEPRAGISAIVSRGGRPDLAGDRLAAVRAPTLLIVGSEDHVVVELNRTAANRMLCEHRVAIVPGATHLFEESGTLGAAADLAASWFASHLVTVEDDVPSA